MNHTWVVKVHRVINMILAVAMIVGNALMIVVAALRTMGGANLAVTFTAVGCAAIGIGLSAIVYRRAKYWAETSQSRSRYLSSLLLVGSYICMGAAGFVAVHA